MLAVLMLNPEHLAKVRKNLMDESSAIDRAETAKKQREIKKFGKKVQQQVLEKRQQEKSAMMGKKKTVSDQRQGRYGVLYYCTIP